MKKTFLLGFSFAALLFMCGLVLYRAYSLQSTARPLPLDTREEKPSVKLPTGQGYRFYYNQNEKIGFFYPDQWRVKVLQPVDSLGPFLEIFVPGSKTNRFYSTIYVGGPSVFSTSGAVCANQTCEKVEELDFRIMGKTYYADLIQASAQRAPDYKPIFEYLAFQIPEVQRGLGLSNVYITSRIPDGIEKEIVGSMIQNIQFIDLDTCSGCPQYAPTPPGWCAQGEIVQGDYQFDQKKNCYCTGPAECIPK